MAISARAAGAWAYAASGSVTPTLPTHQAGDILLVRVHYKSSNIANCLASTATSGWTKGGEFHDGTTNSGNGLGSCAAAGFWKIAESSSETNPTIDFSQTVTQVGHSAVSFQKGASETWLAPVVDGGGFTAATNISATIQSHIPVQAGDMVVFSLGSRDDSAFTVPTITQTGVTFAAVTEYPATAGIDASGADGSYDAGYRLATAGTSSAAAVITATLAASESGAAGMSRLRVQVITPLTADIGITFTVAHSLLRNYAQAIALGITFTVAQLKKVNKVAAIAVAFTLSTLRRLNYARAITVTFTVSALRRVNKIIAAAVTFTLSTLRLVNKVIGISVTLTPSVDVDPTTGGGVTPLAFDIPITYTVTVTRQGNLLVAIPVTFAVEALRGIRKVIDLIVTTVVDAITAAIFLPQDMFEDIEVLFTVETGIEVQYLGTSQTDWNKETRAMPPAVSTDKVGG